MGGIAGLIEQLPDHANVGLLVYGTGTSSADSAKAEGCQDVKTLTPVGPVDKAAMTAKVAGIQASGYTPIGLALQKAADELPGGEGAIVLVSDGIDTCALPPPCEVAKEIAASGIDVTVHTVGFRVDQAARADLACIAEFTGGTYADAVDADQLSEALEVKVEYAITGYDVKGTPITGALDADASELPVLEPGQWVDTFDARDLRDKEFDLGEESFRCYRMTVPEGYRAHVAATLVPAAMGESSTKFVAVQATILDAEGRQCAQNRNYVGANEVSMMPPIAVASADCDGEVVVELRRDGTALLTNDLPVEILVRFEPPADATGLPLPERRPGPAAPAPDVAAATAITAGTSFNSAVELTPGKTYRSMIATGEAKLFKVPLTWGQQLSYSVDFAEREEGADTRMSVIRTHLHSPLRGQISPPETEMNGVWMISAHRDPVNAAWSTPEPVRYGSEAYGMDGFYYISIAEKSGDASFVLDSFHITVDVAGDIEEGPHYLVATPSPTPAQTTEVAAPADPSDAVDHGDSALGRVLAGAAVLVVAAGAATVLFVRRRGRG